MSKAFTREDDAGETPVLPRLVSPLPPGARNHLTPAGAKRLREELVRRAEVERPSLLAQGAAAREELARVEQRIAYLEQSLRTGEVVTPPAPPHEVVRFGATVTVRDQVGTKTSYRIVGVDETDAERNEVSWLSPIGRALLNARLGQKVPFKFPAGAAQLEIVRIDYE